MMKVSLDELISAIGFQSDEAYGYIDKRTNAVCPISDEVLAIAEEGNEDYPDWMTEDVELARAYLNNPDNFVALPSQYDVNEYRMMEEFAHSLNNEDNAQRLLIALSGKGAFRRFKDTINALNLSNDWYTFKDTQYAAFIKRWYEQQDIMLDFE